MLQPLPSIDSDDHAAARKAELMIPRDKAAALGWTAVDAISGPADWWLSGIADSLDEADTAIVDHFLSRAFPVPWPAGNSQS